MEFKHENNEDKDIGIALKYADMLITTKIRCLIS